MQQRPHITVATVVERDGQFLMVREQSDGLIVYNQPAGHLEENETLIAAALRETLEETAWQVEIRHLLGIYQYTSPTNGICYVRHCFIADPIQQLRDHALDPDIIEAQWLSLDELESHAAEMRSPLVLKAVTDYLSGQRFPLTLLADPEH